MKYASTLSHTGASSRFASEDTAAHDGRAERRRSPYWLPLAIVALVIFVVSAEFEYAATGGQEITDGVLVGSTRSRQIAFVVLGAMGTWLLLRNSTRNVIPVWPMLIPAAFLLAYTWASAGWSEAPMMTVKRVIVMTCIVAAGFGLGKSWTFSQFSWAILTLSICFLIVSIGAELRYHTWLSDPGDYRFSGIFHPAKQAFNCGMLALASLTLYFAERRKVFLLITAIAFAFLFLTKARTGLAATMIACGVLVWPQLSKKTIVTMGMLAACLAAGLLVYFGSTGKNLEVARLAKMGREEDLADPTKLTGRLPIWSQALSMYGEKPILGFGYGAFWTERRLSEFERENGWRLTHAHSAYIELLVNIGAIGFLLSIGVAAIALVRSIRLSSLASTASARLVAALFVLALVSGLTEIAFIKDGYEFLALAIGVGLLAFEPPNIQQTLRRPRVHGAFSRDRLCEAQS